MSRRNNQDQLAQLLQRGDPAGNADFTMSDPMRRAALLTRCSESLAQTGYARKGRTRIPLAVGAFALSAGLLVLFLWVRKTESPPSVPPVAVVALPMPAEPLPGDALPSAEKIHNTPAVRRLPIAVAKSDEKGTVRRRIAARKSVRDKRPSFLGMRGSPVAKTELAALPQPNSKPARKPAPEILPEPVVEKALIIADAAPSDTEPNAESVSIILTEKTRAVVSARPIADETRR